MRKFLIKILLFASPFFILFGIYLIADPFKVVHSYSSYFPEEGYVAVNPNFGYISTMNYKQKVAKEDYNSFIFGNSRSVHFLIDDWKPYLPKDASCYHFNADGESLYGMMKKMEYIDSIGGKLDNALIILDTYIIAKDKPEHGHLFQTPPELENGQGKLQFQWLYVKAFFNTQFFFTWLDLSISGEIKPYMSRYYLISNEYIKYNSKTNELREIGFEKDIADGKYYTESRIQTFESESRNFCYNKIRTEQKQLLSQMAKILKKQGTDNRIILCPTYDKVEMDKSDLETLYSIFDKERIFNFCGKNKYTTDYHNFYDPQHPRPITTRELLKKTYRPDQTE